VGVEEKVFDSCMKPIIPILIASFPKRNSEDYSWVTSHTRVDFRGNGFARI